MKRSIVSLPSEQSIESQIEALARLDVQRPKYRDQLKERSDLREKKLRLIDQHSDSAREIKSRLAAKLAELGVVTSRMTQVSELSTSIRASAETVVSASRTSTCPCCSHDWKSPEALLAAISGNGGPYSDPYLKHQLDSLRTEIDNLQAKKARADLFEAQLRECDAKLAGLDAWIHEYERLAEASGIAQTRLLERDTTLPELLQMRSLLNIRRLLQAFDELDVDLNTELTTEDALAELSVIDDARRMRVNIAEQKEAERKLVVQREQNALEVSAQLVEEWERRLEGLERIRHQRDEAKALLSASGISLSEHSEEALRGQALQVERLGNLIMHASAAVEASVAISASERINSNLEELKSRRDRISAEFDLSGRLIDMLTDVEAQASQRFFSQLGPAVGTLFDHMQVNRVFRTLSIRAVNESFSLNGQLSDGVALNPSEHFSQGQRQDLALSMFLVRAASLGGSFFLDEPLVHLDDLNRTALLDCLRACVLGTRSSARPVHLIVTTANWTVARHMMQKFHSVPTANGETLLRVIQLSGNVGSRVEQSIIFPADERRNEIRPH